MPLFTSSFDPRLISDKHTKFILFGFLAGILMILLVENILRFKGGMPDVRDTPELWASQRARASSVGDEALILVGSSKIQLGLDLGILGRETGMTPVQLAIDGSPNLEVIENLANDETVAGTVLISTSLRLLFPGTNAIRVKQWIDIYDKNYRNLWYPKKELQLKAKLQSVSALYANIIPLEQLFPVFFDNKKRLREMYLKTLSSRERNADFSLVKMPDLYLRRVQRNLGQSLPVDAFTSYDDFRDVVIRLTKENYSKFNTDPKRLRRIKSAIEMLKKRGVEVIIARFPSSGLVESISDIRYPKALWDKAISDLGIRVIDYRDYPELAYQLPDGSHLDIKQKPQFTHHFVRILLEKDTSH